MKRVTGPRLARALRAGALAVVRQQDHLDAINAFPVPDADAGTGGPALGVHAGPGAVGVAVHPEGGKA